MSGEWYHLEVCLLQDGEIVEKLKSPALKRARKYFKQYTGLYRSRFPNLVVLLTGGKNKPLPEQDLWLTYQDSWHLSGR